MKIFILLFALANISCSWAFSGQETTAFNYFEKIGIPEAIRLKNAEDEYLRNPTHRVVGGVPAETNEFPYQAGLLIDMEQGNALCGASLLSPNRLVTAAHCWFDGVNQARQYTVVLGSVTLFSGGTRLQTTDVVPHPEWNPQVIRNDLAMIKLSETVTLSASISPINLPSGSDLQNDYSGATAVVSGFGKTSDSSGITINQFLSQVSLRVYSNSICSIVYPGIVQDSNICTSGSGSKGPCGGDSGGPLVVNNNGNVLVGIVSFGSAHGCSIGLPSAYTRVTSFIDFIQQHM